MSRSTILVTGGAGYIGSATCKHLSEAGYEVVVFDNLSTGHAAFVKWGDLVVGDIRDGALLRDTLRQRNVRSIVHFAARASVAESVLDPRLYYDTNVLGTFSLLEAMREAAVGTLVVSSSCAVYGERSSPIDETGPLKPINPYGFSKLVMEGMCRDYGRAYGIRTVALRYFNAAGAVRSMEVGERHDPETHLVPRILMAASGTVEHLDIFGSDYPSADGTAVRDYVHVADLAEGHLRALEYLLAGGPSIELNLGTGTGVSVLDLVRAAERITSRPVPCVHRARRDGDPPSLVADPTAAFHTLGWRAKCSSLDEIVETAWKWFLLQQPETNGGTGARETRT